MQAAGPVRLRPIVMTSIATMMAAIPAALGLGPGIRDARADGGRGARRSRAVDGLSLLVVPAFYVVADAAKQKLARKKAATAPHAAVVHPEI